MGICTRFRWAHGVMSKAIGGNAIRAAGPLAFLLLGLALAGMSRASWAQAPAGAPPPAVSVVTVPVQDVAPAYSFIGHVEAIQSVAIVPRVTAFIEAEPVKDGSEVKAGETLIQLQKTQYEAAVQSAQAQLDTAQAQLVQAQRAYARAAELAQKGFEAQANLDQATATRDGAQAAILSAQASLAQAALNLSYCTIRSPIDGRIGLIRLTKGNLVTPTTPPLATVNQLDPIRVVFAVSDRQLVDVEQKSGASAQQIAKGLTVALQLPNATTYAHPGTISFLGNEVDPQTGTVSVYAEFPNPGHLLLPGTYVTVNVRRANPERRPVVPVAAIETQQNGSAVMVVGANDVVREQPVTLGRQIGQDYIVEKGLSGGERVIIAGMQKVRPGLKANPQEAKPAATAQGAAAAVQGG